MSVAKRHLKRRLVLRRRYSRLANLLGHRAVFVAYGHRLIPFGQVGRRITRRKP